MEREKKGGLSPVQLNSSLPTSLKYCKSQDRRSAAAVSCLVLSCLVLSCPPCVRTVLTTGRCAWLTVADHTPTYLPLLMVLRVLLLVVVVVVVAELRPSCVPFQVVAVTNHWCPSAGCHCLGRQPSSSATRCECQRLGLLHSRAEG